MMQVTLHTQCTFCIYLNYAWKQQEVSLMPDNYFNYVPSIFLKDLQENSG